MCCFFKLDALEAYINESDVLMYDAMCLCLYAFE